MAEHTFSDLVAAQKKYEDSWGKNAYQTIEILGVILNCADVDWKSFIQAGGLTQAQEEVAKEELSRLGDSDILRLADTPSGGCAQWCVGNAKMLDSETPATVEQFIVGSLPGHHAAFSQAGIIIDSSARKAIQVLREGREGKEQIQKGFWWMTNLHGPKVEAHFVNKRTKDYTADKRVSYADGLRMSVRRCIGNKEWVIFFRKINLEGRLGFRGLVKWIPAKRTIELSINDSTNSTRNTTRFVFGEGNRDKHRENVTNRATFYHFLDTYGKGQMEDTRGYVGSIWDDSCQHHGPPSVKELSTPL